MRRSWLLVPFAVACAAPRSERVPRREPAPAPDAEMAEVGEAWIEFGSSVRGRPLRLRTVGSGSRRALWIGGIHGNEREGSVATAELERAFLAVAGLAAAVTLTIVEDVNPDGTAANTRGNANGVDLNRNFPAKNARAAADQLSEPESRALHDLVIARAPDVVLVAHSWGQKPKGPRYFVNFDGPAERLARIFSEISRYPVEDSRHLPPTPGSLGSWVGIDQQIPILTIEYQRGVDPTEAWIDTREAILAAIRG